MKKRNIIIIIGLILVAGLAIYFSKTGILAKAEISGTPKTGTSVHEGHEADGQQTQAQPENAQEQTEEEAPTVEIPVEKQQLIGVKTVEVSVKPLQKIIRTVGRIEYDERRLATVNTKFECWVEKLYVDYTGKHVKKGEPLAEIYSPELVATQQEFLNVLKWRLSSKQSEMLSKDAEALVEAAKQRLRLWDITDAQIKKMEETGMPERTLTIYSPVSGYVVQKMALQGMKVMPGEKLFDIADLSSVWIISDIYEYELPLIRLGQTAAISLSYFPGREFSSKIDYVYPSLSGDTRTAKIRFTIPNPGGQLKPQMFTNVEVKIPIGKKLSIPDDAVIDTGTRQIVYVDKGDGYFEPREVMLGVRGEGFREVIMGLKAGEKVASSATFLIDSEAQLKNVTPLGGHKH
ncbi:MAG: efflux RND transporter periplasmic adaptor subunit [Nitrospirota bacterium]